MVPNDIDLGLNKSHSSTDLSQLVPIAQDSQELSFICQRASVSEKFPEWEIWEACPHETRELFSVFVSRLSSNKTRLAVTLLDLNNAKTVELGTVTCQKKPPDVCFSSHPSVEEVDSVLAAPGQGSLKVARFPMAAKEIKMTVTSTVTAFYDSPLRAQELTSKLDNTHALKEPPLYMDNALDYESYLSNIKEESSTVKSPPGTPFQWVRPQTMTDFKPSQTSFIRVKTVIRTTMDTVPTNNS